MDYKPQHNEYPMDNQQPTAPAYAGPPPAYAPQPQPVPTAQQPPQYNQPVSLTGYQPYPPVYAAGAKQQSSANVVVVNQPSGSPTVLRTVSPKPPDYLILSLVALALCFFHGNWLTFFCLVPALIFSLSSQNHANQGNYSSAKSMGQAALGCNIAAFVSYIVMFVLGAIAIGVYYGIFYSQLDYGGCYETYDAYGRRITVCS